MTEQQTRSTGPRRGEATAELSVASVVRTGSGIPVVIEVTVTNTGTIASAFSVMAQGVDAAWLPAPVSTPVLGPEQSASVALRIHPSAGTLSAQYPLAVTAQAVDVGGNGGAKTVADLVLVVSPRAQIAMELSPTSVTAWRERTTTLVVRNTGAGVATVRLQPVTTGSLKVKLAKDKLVIAPGASTKVRVRTIATRPQLIGSSMRHRYRILARGTEAERHAEGEFVQHPLVAPVWLKVLGFLLILSVWVGAGVVFIPRLSNIVGGNATISAADIANGVVGGAKAVQGDGGNGKGGNGKGGGGGGGKGNGKGSNGSGTKTGGGPAGGQGKKKATTVQLNGTVTAKDPAGVTVTLKPTSLVDEAAAGGEAKPVGLTGAVLSAFNTTGKVSPLGRILRSSASQEPTSRSVVTGDDGAWTFAGVKAPGYYLVTFTKPGYQTDSYVVDSSAASAQDPLPVTMTAGEGTLSGTVKGPNGKPVGGAAITITDGTSTITASSNTTGDVGHWQVTGLSTPSSYTVSASKNGMSLESKLVDLPASGSLTVDLALHAGVATLTGSVLGADSTGEVVGIGGANVTVSDGQDVTRTATTVTEGDLAGSFTVPSLPVPGDYTVTLSADGYASQTSKIHLAAGQGSLDVGSATLVTSLGTVQGTVKGKVNNSALVGAGMTLTSDKNSYKTTSTSTGDFRINGVTPGTYTLTTQMFGYADDVATVTVTTGGIATINPVLSALPDGVLPATAVIKGSAVDGSTGKALTACTTTTQRCLTATLIAPGTADGRRGGSSVSTTFAEGDSYTLTGLLPGTYPITITAPGYAATSVTATVGEGQTATAPVAQLFPAPHLQGTLNILQGTPTSSTCVFAVSSSNTAFPTSCPSSGQAEPKTGAKCFASPAAPAQYGTTNPTAMCAYTDIASHYRIDLPQDGSWTVYVIPSDPDYIPVGITQATAGTWSSSSPATFTLQHGATQDYSPTLGRYGHIQVTVQRPNSQNQLSTMTTPVDVFVTNDDTATPYGTFTTSGGRVTITGLTPGNYTLSATDPDATRNAVGTSDVTIALNQTIDVTLPLVGPVSPYVGRIVTSVDGNLVPVVGAKVTLTAPVGYAEDQTVPTEGTIVLATDANGCFAVLSRDSSGAMKYPPAQPSTSPCATSDFTVTGTNSAPKSAGLPQDDNGALVPFVSNRVDTLQVSVGTGGADYQTWTPATTGYVFAPTGVNPLQPNLVPNPVAFDGVTIDATSEPASWGAVSFQIAPLTGSAAGLSVSAGPSGTAGVGKLSFSDANASTSGVIRPGTYTITASLTGYESAQGQLTCYAPDTAGADPTSVHTGEIANDGTTCYWQGSRPTLVKDGQITVTTTPGALVQLTSVGPAISSSATVNGVLKTWSGSGPYVISGTADADGNVVFGNLRPVTVASGTANYSLSLIAPPGYYNGTMDANSTNGSTFWVAPECTQAGDSTNLVTTDTTGSYFGLDVDGDVTCSADLHGIPAVTLDGGGNPVIATTDLATGTISGTVVGYESTTGTSPQTPVNGVFVQAFYCNSQSTVASGSGYPDTCDITKPDGVTVKNATATATTANDGAGNDGTFTLAGGANTPLVAGYYEVKANGINGWADDQNTPTTTVVQVANGQVSSAGALALRQVPATLDISVNYIDHGTPHQYDGATITLTNTASASDTCSVGVDTPNPVATPGSGIYHCPDPLAPGDYNWTVSSPLFAGMSGTYTLGSGSGSLAITLSPFATSFSGSISVDDGTDLSTLHHDATGVVDGGAWVYVCTSATDCWSDTTANPIVTGTDGLKVRVQPASDGSFTLANIPANDPGEYYYVWARDPFNSDHDNYLPATYQIPQTITSSLSTSIVVPPGSLKLTAKTGTASVALKPTDDTDNLCGAKVSLRRGSTTITKTVSGSACGTGGEEDFTASDFGPLVRGDWTLSVDLSGLSSGGTHAGAGALFCTATGCDATNTTATLTVPVGGSAPASTVWVEESAIRPGYLWSSSLPTNLTPPHYGVNITADNGSVSETVASISYPGSRGSAVSCKTTGSQACPLWLGPGDWDFSATFATSQSVDDSWVLTGPTDTVQFVTGGASASTRPTVTYSDAGGTNDASGTTPTIVLTRQAIATTVNVKLPDGNPAPSGVVVEATSLAGLSYDATVGGGGVAMFSSANNNALTVGTTWRIAVVAGSRTVTGGSLTWERTADQTLTATSTSDLNVTLPDFTINPVVTAKFKVQDQFGRGISGVTISLPDTGATTSGSATTCKTGTDGTCPIANVRTSPAGGWEVDVTTSLAGYGSAQTAGIVVNTCPAAGCNGDATAPGTVKVGNITMPVVLSNVKYDVQNAFGVPLAGVKLSINDNAQGYDTDTSAGHPTLDLSHADHVALRTATCTTSDGTQDTNGDGLVEPVGECVMSNIVYNQSGAWPVVATAASGAAAIGGFVSPGGITAQASGSDVTVPVKMNVVTKNVTVTFKDASNNPVAGASIALQGMPISCGPTTVSGSVGGTCTLTGVPYNFGAGVSYNGGQGQNTAGSPWAATITVPSGYAVTSGAATIRIPDDGAAASPATLAVTIDVLKVNVMFTVVDNNGHALDGVKVVVDVPTLTSPNNQCTTGTSTGNSPTGGASYTTATGTGSGSCIIPNIRYNAPSGGAYTVTTLSKDGYTPSSTATFTIGGTGAVTSNDPSNYTLAPWTVGISGAVTGSVSPTSVTVACDPSPSACLTSTSPAVLAPTGSGPYTSYSIATLGMGTWDITAKRAGYVDGVTTVTIGSDKSATVGGDVTLKTAVDIAVGDPKTAEDTVVDLTASYTGSSGTVTATSLSDNTKTRVANITSGKATFTDGTALYYDPLGWALTVSITGYAQSTSATVTVDTDGSTTIVGGPITMTPTTGTLEIDDIPSGATVAVDGTNCVVDGTTCSVSGLSESVSHTYSVSLEGYTPITDASATITGGQVTNESGALTAWTDGQISGTITNSSGAPVVGAQITATCQSGVCSGTTSPVSTNGSGNYSLTGLKGGVWKVHVDPSTATAGTDTMNAAFDISPSVSLTNSGGHTGTANSNSLPAPAGG